MNSAQHHKDLVAAIQNVAGGPAEMNFLSKYLGSASPAYPIKIPQLRQIAKDWLKLNPELTPAQFTDLLGRLFKAKTNTEKMLGGILLNESKSQLHAFDPHIVEKWLTHLTGWAETDTLCTGKYAERNVEKNLDVWEPLLKKLSASELITHRRASLVWLCTPLRNTDDPKVLKLAFALIHKACGSTDIMLTKAISWLLRSGFKYHKVAIRRFVEENRKKLPAIAVRETLKKLDTGKK